MNRLSEQLDSIVMECARVVEQEDSHDRTFFAPSHRYMHGIESEFSRSELLAELTRRLTNHPDDAAAIVFLSSLKRAIPFEYLSTMRRGESTTEKDIRSSYSNGVIDAIISVAQSSSIPNAVTALNLAERIPLPETLECCMTQIESKEAIIRKSAVLNSCALSDLDEKANSKLQVLFDQEVDPEIKLVAFDSLFMGNVKESTGRIMDIYKSAPETFSNSKYLDTLLDLGGEEFNEVTTRIVGEHAIRELPDVTQRRIMRHSGLSRTMQAASHELLSSAPLREATSDPKYGMLVHRNSKWSSAWVGHAGIYVGDNQVIHVTTGHDPHACRLDSLSKWKEGNEFWGFRWDKRLSLTAQNREKVVSYAREVAARRTKYDGTHNNQKGKWFRKCVKRKWGWAWCIKKKKDYWESDCVGFSEHCFEHSGGDPSRNKYESGMGWPLTVREQRDETQLKFRR